MQLSGFIQDLIHHGNVTVATKLLPFSREDIDNSVIALKNFYDNDVLELPGKAPEFNAEAAIWGAIYLYRTIQLIMLRDLADEAVTTHLKSFPATITPEVSYSADLCFRYLPGVLLMAKGLAPDDILVKSIKQTGVDWPFSSINMDLEFTVDARRILQHTSLKYAYIDRIIEARDIKRVNNHQLVELIHEALGDHAAILWPEFSTLYNHN